MKRTLLFGAIASFVVVNAYASNIVTSKTYVDNRDALKVDIAQGVGTNNANVGKTLVVNSSGNLELGTPAAGNYVEDSITNDVTDKAPSENAVHDALAGKQDEIQGYNSSTEVQSVLTDTTNDGQIGKKAIVTYEQMDDAGLYWDDYEYGDDMIPTLAAVGNMISDKQDAISTAEVEFYNAPNDTTWSVPALVTYNTSNGMLGNNVGIVNLEALEGESVRPFNSAIYDHFVPSLRVVSTAIEQLWNDRITWSSDETTAVNNYSTSFAGTTGNWPANDGQYFVDWRSLAQGLALKQNRQIGASPVGNANSTDAGKILVVGNDGKIAMSTATDPNNFQTKIPARATKIESTDSTYAPSVVTNGTIRGSVGQMAILTRARVAVEDGADGGEFADYTNADNLIPTAAAVGAELYYKQNMLSGSPEYAGKVVTATQNAGQVTYTAIDSTPTSASTNLVTSGGVYTAVNAKQTKKTCAGWPDGVEHTDANCWLWNMPD